MKQKQKQKHKTDETNNAMGLPRPRAANSWRGLEGNVAGQSHGVCCWHFNDADQMSSILISCLPTSWANPLQRVAHTPRCLEAVVARCR